MRIRRQHLAGLALLLCATGCSTIGLPLAGPSPAPRDHFDPAYLNEAAIAAWSKGERGTALLLLERAAVLAPQDRRIASNLEALSRAGSQTVPMQAGPFPEVGADLKSGEPSNASRAPATSAQTGGTPATITAPLPQIGIWPLK